MVTLEEGALIFERAVTHHCHIDMICFTYVHVKKLKMLISRLLQAWLKFFYILNIMENLNWSYHAQNLHREEMLKKYTRCH
jgi:hypothetical protein